MKELLTVARYNFNTDWTISKLYLNGFIDGYSVEDEIRSVKVKGETAIPFGRYELGLRISPKFSETFYYSESFNVLIDAKDVIFHKTIKDFKPHELIWIKNVPDFEYILLHWGNTDDDTDGCLIVGGGLGIINGQEGVTGSRDYYKKLYPKVIKQIKQGHKFIEYIKAV